MDVRRFVVVAVVAGAVAGPVAAAQVQVVSRAVGKASVEANDIELEVRRNGSLAATLRWSGGTGPYDVLIDPAAGEGRYTTDVDDRTITVAAEPRVGYCFQVFGSDRSKSSRECLAPPR
jgi:hypothetical protein